MHKFRPESLMMSHGYKPEWSEGAIKCPIFQTSTFVFKNAQAGKDFFEVAYGHRQQRPDETQGLIYSRINNPDLEILEERLKLWDEAEGCAVFESGMSAITTVLMEFLRPGDVLLACHPLYGGTHHFMHHVLTSWGIETVTFNPDEDVDVVEARLRERGCIDRLKMVYLETPTNPTNAYIDIEAFGKMAKGLREDILLVVDNTYMGPLWQQPLKHGADLVLYSATKYIGGHSDVIAGACLGNAALMQRVKVLRTFLGNMCSPNTGWLLMRSLETLKVRMEAQARGAMEVARFLAAHDKVEKVYFPEFYKESDPRQYAIYKKQCSSAGAMVSFDMRGGEAEAFRFLDNLKLIKLAVSLGGTESLGEHPATMTHCDIAPADRAVYGISEKMVRLSIGVEHPEDLIYDIGQALEAV